MSRKKKISLTLLCLVLLLAALGINHLNKMAKIGVGYMVKVTCSEVFLAERDLDDIMASDFADIDPLMTFVRLKLDENQNTLKGSLFGLGKSKGVYREGIGCSLDVGDGLSEVALQNAEFPEHNYTESINPNVQAELLKFFTSKDNPDTFVTRGALVIQNGQVIAEHYKKGFDKDSRQQSWSMAKGFTQALIGIAVKDKLLSLEDNELMPDWKAPDPRSEITLGHLLHMASGLEFREEYLDPFSHVDQMLFNRSDMGEYAASQSLVSKPGTTSIYSSGTTNIVSKILRNTLDTENISYHDYPNQKLFSKLGMNSAIFEVDASGGFIGSSYIYATVRDFAKFGQLYLQNGVWNNEQLLPVGWVDYTRTPAKHSEGKYGSHWSVNASQKNFPSLPKDVIALGGNDGQYIFVIPDKNAVIVRLGIMREPANFANDLYPVVKDIYQAL